MDWKYVCECKPCDKIFNSISVYNDHMASEKHKRKVNSAALMSNNLSQCVDKPVELAMDEYIQKCGNEFKCHACNMFMNHISTALSHKKGQKHLKTISKVRGPVDSLHGNIDAYKNTPSTLSELENNSVFCLKFPFHVVSIEEVLKDITVFKVNDPIIF